MSFREKSAWISLLSMSGIYGIYFWSVIHADPLGSGFHFGGLLGTIIALESVQVDLTVGVAIITPRGSQGAARRARQTDRAQGDASRLCRACDGHCARLLFRSVRSPTRV